MWHWLIEPHMLAYWLPLVTVFVMSAILLRRGGTR